MRIATIRSLIHAKVESLIITDEGFYELGVNVNMAEARASGDPKGFCNKEIAQHLASCVEATGIPVKEGYWTVEFSQWAQTNLDYPGGFRT